MVDKTDSANASGGEISGLRLAGPGISAAGITASAADIRDAARKADEAGFDYFALGDTVFREVYTALALCAEATQSIRIGPGVTNPLTRHPVVTASSVSTLDEISAGRTFLGIGMGQSANAIAGLPQATPEELRSALRTIASAMRRASNYETWPPGLEIDESVVELQWVVRRVPVLVAAGFRQGLQIAAELADGVMLRAGDVDWSELPSRIEQLHAWRSQGVRTGDPFEVQLLMPSFITDSVEEGRRVLGGIVSARANTSTREHQLPDDLIEPWRRFRAHYDYAHHSSTVHPVNVRLMEDLGLADYFFNRFSVIGNEEDIIAKLEEVERAGVTATMVGEPFKRATEVLHAYRARHQLPLGATPLRRKGS